MMQLEPTELPAEAPEAPEEPPFVSVVVVLDESVFHAGTLRAVSTDGEYTVTLGAPLGVAGVWERTFVTWNAANTDAVYDAFAAALALASQIHAPDAL